MATIRLPCAGPKTSLKSVSNRLFERRPLADFRLVVGPAHDSRMVAKRFRADRDIIFLKVHLAARTLKKNSYQILIIVGLP